MRCLVALAALALLTLAAWVSIGGNGDGRLGPLADDHIGLVVSDGGGRSGGGESRPLGETPDRRLAGLQEGVEKVEAAQITLQGEEPTMSVQLPRLPASAGSTQGEVDADVTRLLSRWPVDRRDVRVAGQISGCVEPFCPVDDSTRADSYVGDLAGEAVDEAWLQTLEEATAYYGVEWARDELIIVRFRESSNIVWPCVVGLDKEQGPFQFKLSTWAGTPYSHLDPCDLEAATWAAAWKVSQPEGWRAWWSTWPR